MFSRLVLGASICSDHIVYKHWLEIRNETSSSD